MQMAASVWKSNYGQPLICMLLSLHSLTVCHNICVFAFDAEYVFQPSDILDIVDHSCFVGFSLSQKSDLESTFADVANAFKQDESVVVGFTDLRQTGEQFKPAAAKIETEIDNIEIFHKMKKDRTCLPASSKRGPKITSYTGDLHINLLVEFVNEHCDTYRNSRGQLTVEGLHRQEILQSLFHVHHVSDVSTRKLFKEADLPYCSKDSCSNETPKSPDTHIGVSGSNHKSKNHEYSVDRIHMPTCDKVPYPSKQEFFHNYLKISKPVIFTGAMESWSARTKWSNSFLREKYGEERVHIKLTPSGEYEGVDSADQFENFESFNIPAAVKKQLLFPDLVVVRPASANMNLSTFLDIVEEVSNGRRSEFSAYLEYSSLSDIVPDLENDLDEMPFFDRMLELKHLNVWLSDGNTLGKLHFDPFDNFLCQISGRKEVIMFEPHDNTRLYEAHIPEAMLEYNQTTKTFHKKTLLESTSMVMSPVDFKKPDFKRFPQFADTYPLNCTIDEGEVLFMPAFWWHEVQSYPNAQQGRNLAVNFWYDPFLVREFPCQECALDVNPKYRHLL